MIITLCGSTEYKPLFEKIERKFALEGDIVLSLSVFSKHDNIELTEQQKDTLVNLHLQKIDMADLVYIICPKGRIGQYTAREIEYAKSQGKPLLYDLDTEITESEEV